MLEYRFLSLNERTWDEFTVLHSFVSIGGMNGELVHDMATMATHPRDGMPMYKVYEE